MRSRAIAIVAPLVFLSAPAEAHFHLDQPPSAVQQSASGDPQKPAGLTDGCPEGTATGIVTQVHAGGQVHVKITEEVPHGGHYRVSFGADESAFEFPATTALSNECKSTTIAQNPTPPILADGLFIHDQSKASAGNVCNGSTTCETDVTIPNVAPGNYLLQVIEWMTPHSSATNNGIYGCFYAHCANIQVIAPDANIADGGVVVVDAGSGTGSSGGAQEDPSADGNASSGSSGVQSPTPASDGCGVTSANGASLWAPVAPVLGALAGLCVLRRRKRARR